jgi:hypothetical protein
MNESINRMIITIKLSTSTSTTNSSRGKEGAEIVQNLLRLAYFAAKTGKHTLSALLQNTTELQLSTSVDDRVSLHCNCYFIVPFGFCIDGRTTCFILHYSRSELSPCEATSSSTIRFYHGRTLQGPGRTRPGRSPV